MKFAFSSSVIVSLLLAAQPSNARRLNEKDLVKQSAVPSGRTGPTLEKKKNHAAPPPGGRTFHSTTTNMATGSSSSAHSASTGIMSGSAVRASASSFAATTPTGVRNQNYETHIVGGSSAGRGDYPYFVDLSVIGCGGALIAPRVVLTAAHCAERGSELEGERVVVGAYENVGPGSSLSGDAVRVRVVTQENHPSYNDNTLENDYSLLLLAEDVNIDEPRLTISDEGGINDPAPNTVLTVIGVGTTSSGGSSASSLREVDVPVVDGATCDDMYREDGGSIDREVMFCAGDIRNGGIDSCQGDSGGPIVDTSDSRLHVQVGVVSWGFGCADRDFPGVYSKVGARNDWIRSIVCDDWGEVAEFCNNVRAPTPAPANPEPCGGNELSIEFNFKTDGWASETSWQVADANGGVVTSGNDYSNNELYNERVCLDPSKCYTFTLDDEYGDGFCCDGEGDQFYEVLVNGEERASGGARGFTSQVVVEDIGNCGGGGPDPTPQPTPEPTPGPTPQPTPGPTPEPTPGPTPGPTPQPTPGPTPQPVESNPIPTPAPTPGPTPQPAGSTTSCSGNELSFSIDLTTDSWSEDENSWELVNSDGQVLASDSGMPNDALYSRQICVPSDGCYTATISDSYGDGFCCGNNDPQFSVSVDGTVIGDDNGGSDLDFGREASFSFGECSRGQCTPMVLEVYPDGWASEISLEYEKAGEVVFSRAEGSFTDFAYEKFEDDCLDLSGCSVLTVVDSYGDGLTDNDGDSSDDGKIVLTVNGRQVYNSGDYGSGKRFEIGEGC